jgi:glycosyltransferase 2 family protein
VNTGERIDGPSVPDAGLASPGKNARRAAVFGLVIGVPTSVLFLWLAVRNTDLHAVWAAMRGADVWLVLLAVLLIAGVYLAQSARWRVIAATARPDLVGFTEMAVGAVACNNVLPGRLGELFRARWLSVAASVSGGRAFATVGLDRGCDAVTLFVFLLVTLPFVASTEWLTGLALGAAVLVVVLIGALLGARFYSRTKSRDRRERGWLRRIARDLVDTLGEPIGRRRTALALALSVLAWGSFALAVWLVARSVGIHLTAVECVFVTSVVNLGVVIPSSPGFVGTYQWLAVASLGLFDVPHEDALAFSILLHASWYVPTTLVGGFLVLFRLDWGLRREPGGDASGRATRRAPEYHRADA